MSKLGRPFQILVPFLLCPCARTNNNGSGDTFFFDSRKMLKGSAGYDDI